MQRRGVTTWGLFITCGGLKSVPKAETLARASVTDVTTLTTVEDDSDAIGFVNFKGFVEGVLKLRLMKASSAAEKAAAEEVFCLMDPRKVRGWFGLVGLVGFGLIVQSKLTSLPSF